MAIEDRVDALESSQKAITVILGLLLGKKCPECGKSLQFVIFPFDPYAPAGSSIVELQCVSNANKCSYVKRLAEHDRELMDLEL